MKAGIKNFYVRVRFVYYFWERSKFSSQLGKIKNTKGHKDENRNRCRVIY